MKGAIRLVYWMCNACSVPCAKVVFIIMMVVRDKDFECKLQQGWLTHVISVCDDQEAKIKKFTKLQEVICLFSGPGRVLD